MNDLQHFEARREQLREQYLPEGEATRIVKKAMENLSQNKDNTGYTVAPLNPGRPKMGGTISEKELGPMKKLGPQ